MLLSRARARAFVVYCIYVYYQYVYCICSWHVISQQLVCLLQYVTRCFTASLTVSFASTSYAGICVGNLCSGSFSLTPQSPPLLAASKTPVNDGDPVLLRPPWVNFYPVSFCL
jgi:hypothetical protein